MQVTITLPDTITIPVGRKGKYGELSFDPGEFSPAIIAQLALHGLKQKVNDPIGDKTLAEAQKFALAKKVAEALRAGEWRVNGTGPRETVVRDENHYIVQAAMDWLRRKVAKEIGSGKPADVKAAIAARFPDITGTLAKIIAKVPDVTTAGKAAYAEAQAKAAAVEDIGLDDLGLDEPDGEADGDGDAASDE